MFLDSKKYVLMMVGLPASGKTTIINAIKEKIPNIIVVSSDDYIEAYAEKHNITYNEAFLVPNVVDDAHVYMDGVINHAIKNNLPVIWDQTNLTAKIRDKKLRRFPNDYAKIAFVLKTPDKEEWERRLKSRPGKTIPEHILKNMLDQFRVPTYDENFDLIVDYTSMKKLFEFEND